MPDFDYPAAAVDDSEEQKKKLLYPAPSVYQSAPSPNMDMTANLAKPSDYAMPKPPQQPQWSNYAPPEKHGLAKVGSVLASLNPVADDIVNVRPMRTAERNYGAATKEYETQAAQNLAGRKEASEEELHHAQATQDLQRPLTAEDIARINAESREKVAETGAGSRENVAKTGATSRENVADTNAAARIGATNQRPPIRVMGERTYERTPEGNWKDIGAAPPRTEEGNYSPVNDETGATVGWVDPKSGRMVRVNEIKGMSGEGGAAPAGIIPPKPTGQSRSREDQATVVIRAGDNLIGDIQSNKGKLGNTDAIIKSALLGTPWADPETQQLRAEIASFAALNPAMHGFRGTDALKQFEKIIGGIPTNPDALIAAIQGIQKTAHAFKPPTPEAPTDGGGDTYARDPQGKLHKAPAGTPLPKGWKPERPQ